MLHIAFFIALLTVIREPPVYTEWNEENKPEGYNVDPEELTKAAKVSFYTLIILHFLTAAF